MQIGSTEKCMVSVTLTAKECEKLILFALVKRKIIEYEKPPTAENSLSLQFIYKEGIVSGAHIYADTHSSSLVNAELPD